MDSEDSEGRFKMILNRKFTKAHCIGMAIAVLADGILSYVVYSMVSQWGTLQAALFWGILVGVLGLIMVSTLIYWG